MEEETTYHCICHPHCAAIVSHAASKSPWLALSYARWCPSSSRLVRLSSISPVFLLVFSFIWFPGCDTQCPSFISYSADVPCPRPRPFPSLTCSIKSVTFVFSLTQMFVFLSRYVKFNILLSIFVCVAASLFFARQRSGKRA